MLKQAATANVNTNNLVNLKNVINNISALEYDPNIFWSPQIYIENAIGDLKEEIRYKLEIIEKPNENQFLNMSLLSQMNSTQAVNAANQPNANKPASSLPTTAAANVSATGAAAAAAAAAAQLKNIANNLTVRVCEMRKLRGVFYERLELYDFPME
jgi:hypothetical protein